MCDCNVCNCKKLCCYLSAFKEYQGGGVLDEYYYSNHFNVGAVDEVYELAVPHENGSVIKLRLVSTAGGILKVDVHHLSGNMSQIQLVGNGSWAELHVDNCMWHLADHVGATCT